MGQIFSYSIHNNLSEIIRLSQSYTSYILSDSLDTLYIDVNYIEDKENDYKIINKKIDESVNSFLVYKYRDQIKKLIICKEFNDESPHLFRKVIFHTRTCDKIIVINNLHNIEGNVDLCINMYGFENYEF